MYQLDTPKNISDIKISDICSFVPDNCDRVPSAKVRLNYVKMLYDVLGLTLTPDIALASIAESTSILTVATAGGGKTTWSQIKAILQKLYRKTKEGKSITGDRILCLVYNAENVKDMKRRHSDLVKQLKASSRIKNLDIDDYINASTIHAFCDFWRMQYVVPLGLMSFSLLKEEQSFEFMNSAIISTFQKFNKKGAEFVSCQRMKALYNLKYETLSELDELTKSDAFTDIGLDISLIEACFERYDALKKIRRKYDFIDMIYRIYVLLRDNLEIRKRVQCYYDYVIVDEAQDLTPLMWELVKMFVDNRTPITCIGDDDQSIYKFRGSNIYDLLDFPNKFYDAKVYMLSTNHRCREAIFDEAKQIILSNKLRFDKVLQCSKPGGCVHYEPYLTDEGQLINLVKELKKLPLDELDDTVVCYRELNSSKLLADMLCAEDIPFHVLRGYMPFSHEFYKHIFSIFDGLEMPCDRENTLNLVKVLPCSREQMSEALGYNCVKRKFTKDDTKQHFAKRDYGKLEKFVGFRETINLLEKLSEELNTKPMNELFPAIYKLFLKYYWLHKKRMNGDLDIDELMESRAITYFNSEKPYPLFFERHCRIVDRVRLNTSTKSGVAISTFHSLKGLEFSHVFAIFLDDDIFPNYRKIENKSYSQNETLALKECEARLWYVTLTRAKDDITIFYNKTKPSIYVAEALQRRESLCSEHIVQSDEFEDFEKDKVNEVNLLDITPSFQSSNFLDAVMNTL